MPFPNEHAARLKNPKDFEPKSFRRTNGGTIYGTKKVPKTIAIIWAKLKGKSKPSDPPIPQSLRFPTKNWTVSKAKQWLKDNKIKYQSFEPAKKKEKGSMSNDTAPINACVFNDNSEVTFTKDDSGPVRNSFKIVGYTGGIMNHWFWGNLALDLKGMKFAKKRTPVLQDHFKDIRIGFTTRQEIKDQVIVEGPFLDNADAQKLKDDMEKGFPMEASMFMPPSIVEHVKEGASVKVNGHILKGPGAVFRQCTIKEVSMCVFGADTNTKSSVCANVDNQKVKFNLIQENNIMDQETEITSVDMFAEKYPELHGEVFAAGKAEGLAEGKTAERSLFASLQEACGNDHELLVDCFAKSKTAVEAAKLHVEKLEKETTALSTTVTELKKKKPVDPAATEFADEATPPGGDGDGESNKSEEAWKQEFSESADLKAEFGGDVAAYVAFKKEDAAGNVRIAHKD